MGIDEDSRDDHGGEISDSKNESEMGSENDVSENNCLNNEYHDDVVEENTLDSKCEKLDEEVDQSIVNLANAFEARLDAPGLDTPLVLPIVDVENTPPPPSSSPKVCEQIWERS